MTCLNADERVKAYVKREMDEIISIYIRLYPKQNLTIMFYQGADPVWSAPSIQEGPVTFAPAHVNVDFLGRWQRLSEHPAATDVTVFVSIPRKPLPSESKQTDSPWAPARFLGRLHRAWPIGYEELRYRFEMRRKRKSAERFTTTSLSYNNGETLIAGIPSEKTDQRPAILIGMHWLEVGGAERLGFDCIEWALNAGLRVFVVADVPSIQRLSDKLPDHPDVVFIRLDRYLPGHLWPRYLEKLVAEENIGLIHIHHCRRLYDALPHLRATQPGIKVIDSTHIIEYVDGGFPRTSGVWTNFVDHHHVISGELTNYFRDTFHVMHKIVLGRMLTRHATDDIPALNMRAGKKQMNVSFIGRLAYQKRPVVLAMAMRALADWARANGVEMKFTIVGEGPFMGTIQKIFQKYGLTEAVRFMESGADVPELLRQSDILLLPSNNEGLALVCYEAIEQGCIPISTDVGSQNEVVPKDLLVPLAPRACVKGIVSTVDRLWRDQGFIDHQRMEMQRLWSRLSEDPTAEEVLMPIYLQAAQSHKGIEE